MRSRAMVHEKDMIIVSPPLFDKKRNGNIYEIERHGPWERCDHLVSPSPFDCRKCRQTSGQQMHVQSSRG
jgi:hypothetical protein